MGLARSTYYDAPDASDRRHRDRRGHRRAICDEFELYGWRRVRAALRQQGMVVNHKKVRRLMREHDLQPRLRRRFVATTDSDHDEPIFPNLAQGRSCRRPRPALGRRHHLRRDPGGFVYVAVILDAWSRRVVGYAISRSIDARLTVAALSAAIERRQPRQAASITPTAARNMLPRSIAKMLAEHMASSARWAGAAIPTTTPRPRAS